MKINLNTTKLLNALKEIVPGDELVWSAKEQCFIARRTFFYRHGRTAADFEGDVAHALCNKDPVASGFLSFTITGRGEIDKPFRGGASIAQSSHWWVKFTVAV